MEIPKMSDIKIDNVGKAIAIIQQLRGGMSENIIWYGLKKTIQKLISSHPLIFFKITSDIENSMFFRGRLSRNGKKFNNISQLLSRQDEDITTYGRCNKPGQSIYYASSNIDTVLSELSPDIGDSIYMVSSIIKNTKSLSMTSVGEFDHWRRYGRALFIDSDEYSNTINNELTDLQKKNDDSYLIALVVDAYLSEAFSQKAYTEKDYKVTSAFCDLVYYYKNENDRGDGVCYPSVKHRGGFNFAIKSDSYSKYMEIESCFVLHITGYLGFGIYTYEIIYESDTILEDGKIEWKLHP